MKKITTRLSFILLAAICLAQSQPAGKTSVAIYPIKAAGSVDKATASALTALLSSELTPSPKLQVIEEAMLKTVMERQALNVSDACDDTSCQVEIGKLVKAQKMITGDLVKLGTIYILSLKLINVQTGAMEFTTKDQCECTENQLLQLVSVAGAKVRNHFGEAVQIPQLNQAGIDKVSIPATPKPAAQESKLKPPVAQPGEYFTSGTKGGLMVFVTDFNFYIDKYEVTNKDYQDCVADGLCIIENRYNDYNFTSPDQPAILIDQNEARTFCQWAGKRLPTEKEWEHAALGTDGRKYPWGNEKPNCNLANYQGCEGKTAPVGSRPAGASPYGALDMAGNAWEWAQEKGILVGGAWHNSPWLGRAGHTHWAAQGTELSWKGGFRCAK